MKMLIVILKLFRNFLKNFSKSLLLATLRIKKKLVRLYYEKRK